MGELYHLPNPHKFIDKFNELPEHITVVSISMGRTHTVSTYNMIVQSPCLLHLSRYIVFMCSPRPKFTQTQISCSSLIMPRRFKTKISIIHLKSGVGFPSVWRCGSIHPNSKTIKSKAVKIPYSQTSKQNISKAQNQPRHPIQNPTEIPKRLKANY